MDPAAIKSTETPIVMKSRLYEPITNLKNSCYKFCSDTEWRHFVAGVSGGVVSTAVVHPFDLIKVRLQVNEGLLNKIPNRPSHHGMLDTAKTIIRQAGFRGLYQGVVPNLMGSGSSWGLYFFAFNNLKARRQNGEKKALDAHVHMWLAAQSGFFTLILTNPIWVAKTRLCLQYDQTMSSKKQFSETDTTRYRGMVDCLRKTYKAEGIRGLYKGFVPGVFGISHGALQFMAYEELKKLHNNFYGSSYDAKHSTVEYLTFAALSKIFAASATYPYQVVRSRLQDQHRKYDGVIHVAKETYRYEGVRGFFKGMVPGIMRVTPACCITFLVYENIKEYLAMKG